MMISAHLLPPLKSNITIIVMAQKFHKFGVNDQAKLIVFCQLYVLINRDSWLTVDRESRDMRTRYFVIPVQPASFNLRN